jgi:hypothetical protein
MTTMDSMLNDEKFNLGNSDGCYVCGVLFFCGWSWCGVWNGGIVLTVENVH